MRSRLKLGLPRQATLVIALGVAGCPGGGSAPKPVAGPPAVGPAPAWVVHVDTRSTKLCGVGVAGAGFDDFSPYPKQFSRERAVKNLAGVLGTNVLEAIVDRNTTSGQAVEMERGLQVDEELIAKIDALAEVEYWLDKDGVGPFAQKRFTYANACVELTKAANTFKVDPKKMANKKPRSSNPNEVPRWINRTGKQKGNRLCAVGFSEPMFFADNTFEAVIEDIRGQLSDAIETLVSQYSEELTTNRAQFVEVMTVATTQAISKGAVVTDFWFDRDGRGPNKHRLTTYGWGCVYPVEVMERTAEAVQQKLPDKKVVDAVKERAAHAFEDLDAEIAKREKKSSGAVASDRPN